MSKGPSGPEGPHPPCQAYQPGHVPGLSIFTR